VKKCPRVAEANRNRVWTPDMREHHRQIAKKYNLVKNLPVKKRTLQLKLCPSCKKTFQLRRSRQVYCCLSCARKGQQTPEYKVAISEKLKGRVVSLETREKLAERQKGILDGKHPEVAEANRKRIWTPEMRKKCSQSHKESYRKDLSLKAKIIAGYKNIEMTPSF